jgi:hypothetical protein
LCRQQRALMIVCYFAFSFLAIVLASFMPNQ